MDGVIPLPRAGVAMPPPAPLDMPAQDFAALPGNVRPLPPAARVLWLWRLAVFGPAILTTGLLLWAFGNWLSTGGLNALETLILVLVGMTFIWISLSVAIASVGLIGLSRRQAQPPTDGAEDLSVALLVPIYNEVPWDVFGNAAAMLDDLRSAPDPRRYALFMLSDTRDEAIADQEWRAFQALRTSHGDVCDIYYRRRDDNTDRKIGNLTNWITHWGAGYDAMLVLDADSLMSGRAIMRLRDALARDPSAGLIQSCPRLIRAETLFGRVQQFANTAYGWLLAEGLALWSQHEGNYWGHNAIIRTKAFAASAGLPHLRGLTGRKHMILSHDFVEAGLLRRAGWAVRFLPDIGGSYEETPASLIDYVIRDRRWCQGNLQHLRLLASRGFHPISRFHLFHGAISYLLSPAWFILLVFWALLGVSPDTGVIQYFSLANPMYPDWPEMSPISSLMLLVFMYSMLLAPKVMGATAIALSASHRRAYGGGRSFALSFLVEVAASIAYAPILMIQQTLAVIRSVIGVRVSWSPQKRDASGYGVRTLIRFHFAETVIGWLLLSGIAAGLISLWLLPIALSLAVAVPLSMLSTMNLGRIRWRGLRLETPQTLREPAVVTRARYERKRLRDLLLDQPGPPIAAE